MDDLNDYLKKMDLIKKSLSKLADRVRNIKQENKDEIEKMSDEEQTEFFMRLGEHYGQELQKKINEKKKSKKRKVSKLAN